MKNITISAARRRALAIAISGDYSRLADRQLLAEAASLHRDLIAADSLGFSLAGGSGLRHVLLRQLTAIDGELARRQDWSSAA